MANKAKRLKEKKEKKKNNQQEIATSSSKTIKVEEIKNMIKETNTIPKEELEKINNIIFKNIVIALCIIIYFMFLNLGYINIKNNIYVTDLKVFSVCILLTAIVLIEIAYKKDSGEIAIYGIEMILIAVSTVALIYINMLETNYIMISTFISYALGIYYVLKSIIIYIRKKKQYFLNDMKEIIVNKD